MPRYYPTSFGDGNTAFQVDSSTSCPSWKFICIIPTSLFQWYSYVGTIAYSSPSASSAVSDSIINPTTVSFSYSTSASAFRAS